MTDGATKANESSRPGAGFDLAARARLRGRLLRYMEEHGIGTPTLQARIAQASGRSVDLIPLKTLQRFIGGQGRTNDAFTAILSRFASDLPDKNDIEDTTTATARFFDFTAFSAGRTRSETGANALTGTYSVYKGTAAPGGHEFSRNSNITVYRAGQVTREFTQMDSRCVIAPSGPGGPLLLRQELFDAVGGADGPRRSFEGIVLFFDPLIVILCKDLATRLPRIYWLREYKEGLAGQAIEAAFSGNAAGDQLHTSSTYLFQPQAA
jgi:hypothetical protein